MPVDFTKTLTLRCSSYINNLIESKTMKKILITISVLFVSTLINVQAIADQLPTTASVEATTPDGECIVGLVNSDFTSIDEEFGYGIHDKTRCIARTESIKLVMQVNKACRDTTILTHDKDGNPIAPILENHARSCGAPRGYGIAQMGKMIKDWTITHGISADKLDLNIIVHGGGGTMLLDMGWNKLKPAVEDLMNKGVKFHFCMNTVRGMAPKMGMTSAQLVSNVIPGVSFVTGGLTALADFQNLGYDYIHP